MKRKSLKVGGVEVKIEIWDEIAKRKKSSKSIERLFEVLRLNNESLIEVLCFTKQVNQTIFLNNLSIALQY